jgi:predicted ATPase
MLNEIKIEGYKSIRKIDLELKPINIMIGSNGVGKSNFISFFKLVNNIYEQRLQNYTMQKGADSLLYYGRKHTKEIYGYLKFSDNAYSFTLQPRDNGSMFLSKEMSYYKNDGRGLTNENESFIKDSDTYRNRWLKDYLQSYKIYHFHDTATDSPLRTKVAINDNRILKTNGDNLAAFLYLLQQQHPKTLKRIEMTIQSVMPYFERFDLAPLPNGTEIDLVWNDITAPDKYFSATDLSDGSIRFIALATLLLQPNLPKVIIIDEPELGLHPVAIVKLSSMIKSAAERGCQIIISTQSVNLISNFEAEDIITVDRKDGQSEFNRLSKENLKEWMDDYSLGELWMKSVIKGQPTVL